MLVSSSHGSVVRGGNLLSALQHMRQIHDASPLSTMRTVRLAMLDASVQQLPMNERNATVLSLESAFPYEYSFRSGMMKRIVRKN